VTRIHRRRAAERSAHQCAAQVQHPGAGRQPFEELLDRPYLALLVREDLVVAGSNSVEAGGLRLLAVCPVVVRGHVIHPGIVPLVRALPPTTSMSKSR